MNLLLDTCTAIWMFVGSKRIGPRVRDVLTDPENDVWFSDVSLLEIVIKHQLGKLALPRSPRALIPALVERHCLATLPIESADVFTLGGLPLRHRDPFDRLLIAQAVERRLTLVTPDPLIRQYNVRVLWDAEG